MSRKNNIYFPDESRLPREQREAGANVLKILRALRRSGGRPAPHVELLPDGRNVVVVADMDVSSGLRAKGYIPRREL